MLSSEGLISTIPLKNFMMNFAIINYKLQKQTMMANYQMKKARRKRTNREHHHRVMNYCFLKVSNSCK